MHFIDLHCHLLPGVDDGPSSLGDTVSMLRLAHSQGTQSLAATPHMFSPYFDVTDPVAINDRFAETVRTLGELGKRPDHSFLQEVSLYLGAENHLSPEFLEALETGQVISYNGGRYLLVELSPYLAFDAVAMGMERVLAAGFVPVLAHAERYDFLGQSERKLATLRQMGCAVQINGESLSRAAGRTAERRVRHLLEHGHVDLIASDGHNIGNRPPTLGAALTQLTKHFPTETVAAWMWENPARILGNRELVPTV